MINPAMISAISPDMRAEFAEMLEGFIDRTERLSVFIKSIRPSSRWREGKNDNEIENLVRLTAEMADEMRDDLDVYREWLLLAAPKRPDRAGAHHGRRVRRALG